MSNSSGVPLPDESNSDTYTHSPKRLSVLAVDDDPVCLLIMERMLKQCNYKVTTCGNSLDALEILRANKKEFDVVISEVNRPGIDGFELLELVSQEMQLPVILVSADGETGSVLKGIKLGACDYMLKPVRIEELKGIGEHVMRMKMRSSCSIGGEASLYDDEKGSNDSSTSPRLEKKRRLTWNVELHRVFVRAVQQAGTEADPKRIVKLMGIHGVTAEDVATHLQKYKIYLERLCKAAVCNETSFWSFRICAITSSLWHCWTCVMGDFA